MRYDDWQNVNQQLTIQQMLLHLTFTIIINYNTQDDAAAVLSKLTVYYAHDANVKIHFTQWQHSASCKRDNCSAWDVVKKDNQTTFLSILWKKIGPSNRTVHNLHNLLSSYIYTVLYPLNTKTETLQTITWWQKLLCNIMGLNSWSNQPLPLLPLILPFNNNNNNTPCFV